MPAALPFQDKISQQSTASSEYRVSAVKYGNGYEQRAQDGINSKVDKWAITWINLNATDYASLISSLDSSYGTDYFNWTAFGDSTSKKWVIDGAVTKRALSGSYYSVSCPFRQDFAL